MKASKVSWWGAEEEGRAKAGATLRTAGLARRRAASVVGGRIVGGLGEKESRREDRAALGRIRLPAHMRSESDVCSDPFSTRFSATKYAACTAVFILNFLSFFPLLFRAK